MLTVIDFIDLWGDEKMSQAAADMIYKKYRGGKFYLAQTESGIRREYGRGRQTSADGIGARFARELRAVVEAHGGGDKEIEAFYREYGGQEIRC